MHSKYLFFLLIPAFFGLASCAQNKKILSADIFEFSNKTEVEERIEEKREKEKPAPKEEEKQEPIIEKEAAKEPKIIEKEELEETEEEIKPERIRADAKDYNFIKRFNIGYLNFNVADFYGEIRLVKSTDDYDRYYFRFFSHSNAFVDYVFGWMSNSVSVFRMDDKGTYPETFQTKVVLKKRQKEMEIRYNDAGRRPVYDVVTPPDNRGKRPAVPDNLKKGTYDFLSIVFEARRLIIKAIAEDNFNDRGMYSFNLPMYDGRRRSDVNLTLYKKTVNNLYRLKINQTPLAGYTENEKKELQKGQRTMNLYLDTKNFWPVSGNARSPIGHVEAKYLDNCSGTSLENCVKLNKEKQDK